MSKFICQAIRERKILEFTYDGYPRTVEPHCHGITSAGNEAIRCYQTAGGSSSGKVPGWHLMKIEKMVDLALSQNGFSGPKPGYKKGDKGMHIICCEL